MSLAQHPSMSSAAAATSPSMTCLGFCQSAYCTGALVERTPGSFRHMAGTSFPVGCHSTCEDSTKDPAGQGHARRVHADHARRKASSRKLSGIHAKMRRARFSVRSFACTRSHSPSTHHEWNRSHLHSEKLNCSGDIVLLAESVLRNCEKHTRFERARACVCASLRPRGLLTSESAWRWC